MIRIAIALGALVSLAGCDLFAHSGEQPIAAGSLVAIGAASRAARRCGVRDTRLDPLDPRRAVLMIGRAHSRDAEACLRHWIDGNRARLDPALLARVRGA